MDINDIIITKLPEYLVNTNVWEAIAHAQTAHCKLDHTNLNFCLTSRIARKSELVGRNIFVNVMHESHYNCTTNLKYNIINTDAINTDIF